MCLFSLEKRCLRGHLTATYNCLIRKDGARLLSEVRSKSMRGDGEKGNLARYEEERFHYKGGQTVEEGPRQVLKFPSLGRFKT